MHLKSSSVNGFRSLAQVGGIPISSPTIAASHNDSSKTALIDSLSLRSAPAHAMRSAQAYRPGTDNRCDATHFEGLFELDEWKHQ